MLKQRGAVLGKGEAERVNPLGFHVERVRFWSRSPLGTEKKPSYGLGEVSWRFWWDYALGCPYICCHAAFLASPKLWGVAKKSPHKRCSSLLSAHCRESDYLLVLSKYVNSNDQISRRRVQSHPSQNFVLFWFRNTAFSSEQFPWGQIQTAHYKQKDARAQ